MNSFKKTGMENLKDIRRERNQEIEKKYKLNKMGNTQWLEWGPNWGVIEIISMKGSIGRKSKAML